MFYAEITVTLNLGDYSYYYRSDWQTDYFSLFPTSKIGVVLYSKLQNDRTLIFRDCFLVWVLSVRDCRFIPASYHVVSAQVPQLSFPLYYLVTLPR